jgi:hypothetical protein
VLQQAPTGNVTVQGPEGSSAPTQLGSTGSTIDSSTRRTEPLTTRNGLDPTVAPSHDDQDGGGVGYRDGDRESPPQSGDPITYPNTTHVRYPVEYPTTYPTTSGTTTATTEPVTINTGTATTTPAVTGTTGGGTHETTTTFAPPSTTTYEAVGGHATIVFSGGQLTLVTYVATPGFTSDLQKNTDTDIDIRFSNGTHESRIRVRVELGLLRHEITENAKGGKG